MSSFKRSARDWYYIKCIFCNKCLDKDGSFPREYTENGTGKFKTITYFHKSCYEKNTIGYMKKKEI